MVYYYRCQKKAAKRLKQRFALYMHESFWKNMEEQIVRAYERTKAIKLSYSPDNTLAYVDFLDLTRDRDDYTGPELPLTFMWSGSGTYIHPFTMNIGDPLLQSIVKLFNNTKDQKAIPDFLERLNLRVRKISFFDFPSITFRCLSQVLEIIHKMNRDHFVVNKLKMYLYVYETKIRKDKQYPSEYSKKFPLNIKILKSEFEAILVALIDDLRVKSILKTHDIKFSIIIDHYDNKLAKEEIKVFHHNEQPSLLEGSDKSSYGSSDSDDDNFQEKSVKPVVTDDDEEYSNMYREAKKAQHKKLIQNDTTNDINEGDYTKEDSEESDEEKTEFFHYMAVPALTCINDKDSSEEEGSFSGSFCREEKKKPGTSINNVKKSYISISSFKRNGKLQNENTERSYTEDIYNKKNRHLGQYIGQFDSTIQREQIGEALFDSTNLKGCKKLYYIYLFILACARFVCFRTKHPVKRTSIVILFYIILIVMDTIITFNLFLHMKAESENERIFSGIGIYFFFFYPGVAIISPLIGMISQFLCRPSFFKFFVMINSISVVSNLTLTFIFQIVHEDKFYYMMEILIVMVLRILQNNLANYQIAVFEYNRKIGSSRDLRKTQ